MPNDFSNAKLATLRDRQTWPRINRPKAKSSVLGFVTSNMQAIANTGITFAINGKEHTVPGHLPASTSLNDYVRNVAGLKGTKWMCQEGGCGCCAVTVSHPSPNSDKLETYSIQSCITPLYAVDGWQITTVEGIGSQKKGFHPIQDGIAKFNGTQCGYCTPGMVMNMYGLLHQKPNITAQEIEDNYDGNICRCTGYRPILDAMKSFCQDSHISGAKSVDIEDLNKHLCSKTGEQCTSGKWGCKSLDFDLGSTKWYRPPSLDCLSTVLRDNQSRKVKLFFGNTESGIYKNEGDFDVWIDLHGVKELYSHKIKSDCVQFGASTSLTTFISNLESSSSRPGYSYFTEIIQHLKIVASVMVRNAGCIAGNLMIKHTHPEFPSDLFTLFEAAGGRMEIYDPETSQFSHKALLEFLKVDMKGKVITAVELPRLDDCPLFRSFKVTPRWQNSYAYVNAALKIPCRGRQVFKRPSIVFGGVSKDMVHAFKTETFLEGKNLSEHVVKDALNILKSELEPTTDSFLSSPKYRQNLAVSLLYKVLLGVYKPEKLELCSGTANLQRPISSGFQTFQEVQNEFPLKKPIPKITSPLQASGEAQFVNDIPSFQHEAFGAFVLGDQANASIKSVDPSEALKMPGVLRFISAADIPEGGVNNYIPEEELPSSKFQELFSSKEICHVGQSVGLILAETQAQAFAAAKKVAVTYSEIRKPILTIEESIEAGKEYESPVPEHVFGQPDETWKTVDRTISGDVRMGTQYHFFLENHISLAVPSEDGIDLYTSTQYADVTQHVAALVIGKPMNYVNCIVPRIGGAFGGKSYESGICASAATLASYVTGRPVRVLMDLSNVVTMGGKRFPLICKYKVGFSNDGDVQVIDLDYYFDCGYTEFFASCAIHIKNFIDMGYHVPNWKIKIHPMMTNKQVATPVRGPAAVPNALVNETIMEHVAFELNKHPIHVKEINLYENGQTDPIGHVLTQCSLRELWHRLKDIAEIDGRMRQVDAFNKENLWKKRGITMTACKFGMTYFGPGFTANVSIFGRDGTVVVSQGGVEMGQGLYTKVAQGVAWALDVPLDIIKVRSNQSLIAPNASQSGGSVSSESAVMSAIEASNILRDRMQPMREKFPDADWKELCKLCCDNKIDLSAKHTFVPAKGSPHNNYFTYFVAAVETKVDILSGEFQILRVDIIGDIGESLNPTIDIGQIEGGYVMGLGAFLTEDIFFDKTSGRILNDGTWDYHPPLAKDIPIDWRIHLIPNHPNQAGVRGSKAVGEPPLNLSAGALFANKLAVQSARSDLSKSRDFMTAVAPYTVEKIQQDVELDINDLTL